MGKWLENPVNQWTAETLVLAGVVSSIIGMLSDGWLGLALLPVLVGLYFWQGLREIPAKPPTAAILTYLGRPTCTIRKAGWHLFPFYGVVFGYIPVDLTLQEQELVITEVRTPDDDAPVIATINITMVPDDSTVDRNGNPYVDPDSLPLYNYIQSGGTGESVQDFVEDVVEARTRQLINSPGEGPMNWRDAQQSQEELAYQLLTRIVGDQFPTVNSSVPLHILMKYFHVPRVPLTKSESRFWGGTWLHRSEAWEKVRKAIAKDASDSKFQGLTDATGRVPLGNVVRYKVALKAQVERRREQKRRDPSAKLPPVKSSVPLEVLLKYFADPKKPMTEGEATVWAQQPSDTVVAEVMWEKVKFSITKDAKNPAVAGPLYRAGDVAAYKAELRKQVAARTKELEKVKAGEASYKLEQYGVIISRVEIVNIRPADDLAAAATRLSIEQAQRLAEQVEVQNIIDRINDLVAIGMPIEKARETVLLSLGKIKKDVQEFLLGIDMDPEAAKALGNVSVPTALLAGAFGRKIGTSGGRKKST